MLNLHSTINQRTNDSDSRLPVSLYSYEYLVSICYIGINKRNNTARFRVNLYYKNNVVKIRMTNAIKNGLWFCARSVKYQ